MQNCLLAIRSRRDERNRSTGDFRETREILTGGFGQFVPFRKTEGAFRPAGELFVNRFALGNRIGAGGHNLEFLAVHLVADAKLDRIQAVEHVELHHRQTGDAVDLHRTAKRGAVEPAAAAGTPRHGTEFIALAAQQLARLIKEFRREGTFADTRAVGLGDAKDIIELFRTHAGTGAGGTCNRIGARYVP